MCPDLSSLLYFVWKTCVYNDILISDLTCINFVMNTWIFQYKSFFTLSLSRMTYLFSFPVPEKDSSRSGDHVSNRDPPVLDHTEEVEPSLARSSIQGLSTSKNAETRSMENRRSGENGPMSKVNSTSDAKQVKGALPAGFFDNKDADLRARGITPVKPDVK